MTKRFRRYLAFMVLGRVEHPREKRRLWNGKGPARDWRYRALVRRLPSVISGLYGCEAAHTGTDGGMRMKASDLTCIPLTPEEHREYHRIGKRAFEVKYGIDCRELVRFLNLEYREGKWR